VSCTIGDDALVALQAIVVAQIPGPSQTVAAPPARGFPAMLWLQRNRYL
jgi:hypothetical protein